jgi:hypothetical protein
VRRNLCADHEVYSSDRHAFGNLQVSLRDRH